MNRLSEANSLYLQQHKDNPVEWWPWCDEALDKAKRENKPILLSIGYASCHWCHVMAHESFENPAIADLMNRHFINIKVDKEERPDLDRVYQTAHQLIVQRPGGWPLTMFLTPDEQLPFFGGTYFPPEAMQGMPGFADVLAKAAEFHAADPSEAARQGAAVRDVFEKLEPRASDDAFSLTNVSYGLRQQLAQHADKTNGGFGRAPKFPQAPSLLWLLHHWRSTANGDEPDVDALFLTALAQARMAEGGLMDHAGGGFFRYCVDAEWRVPHFEKMLYDNALLLQLYSETAQATGDPVFRDAARMTAHFLTTEMTDEAGGFFASIDADSDGVEGAFYTYTVEELREHLDDASFGLAYEYFGLDRPANFEGRWHLGASAPASEIAERLGKNDSEFEQARGDLRRALVTLRENRVRPVTDKKVLTAQNAMAIRALTVAGKVLEQPALIDAAISAYQFLRQHVWLADGLKASWHNGATGQAAFLDDVAHLIDALLALLSVEWRDEWLADAITLTDEMLGQFADSENGGFFFTANGEEAVVYRQKPIGDDALPAGNAVAIRVLERLGYLLGETRYIKAAEAILEYANGGISEFPQAHVSMIDAAHQLTEASEIIVLRGDAATCATWQRDIERVYAPLRWVIAIDNDADLPNSLAVKKAPTHGARAYICRGMQCTAAIDDWTTLAAEIRNR